MSYEDQADAFTMVKTKKVLKLLKELKKELQPTYQWLDQYDDKASEVTEELRDKVLEMSNNLGRINPVDYPLVDKYLKTKVKNNY